MSSQFQNPINPRTTSQHYFEDLLPEDVAFYEQVRDLVTSSHALPFNIPVNTFFHIVGQCLKFFWTWYPMATEEISYYAPYSEIIKFKRGTGYGLRLPANIEDVYGWHLTSGASNVNMTNFIRWNYVSTYMTNAGFGGPGSGSFRDAYKQQPSQVSNLVIQLYEFESYKEMFGEVISGAFNNNTGILNLKRPTRAGAGLIIDCFERIPPEALYDNYDFKEYVIACVEEQLGKIVTAFDFPLIGDVKLNYEDIKSRGVEKKSAIEEELKEVGSNHDIVLFRS